VIDRVEEFCDGNRLRQIGLAAALADLLFVALHREGGDGDDRDCAQFLVVLQPLRHLEAGNLGQLDVHQDQVRVWRRANSTASTPLRV